MRPKVRLAGPDDLPNIVEWSLSHIENAEKLGYPTMRILLSENGQPLQYGFVQGVAVIEGLAPNPKAPEMSLRFGLKAMMDSIVEMCRKVGIREIIAMTGKKDEKIDRLAKHYGFEEVPFKVWRLRI